jgi:phosphatidylinositol alpha-mannosyltransferase
MVSDVYYPHPGGISEHVHHLTLELRRRGHKVDILTAKTKNKHFPFVDPPYVIRIGKGLKFPINKSLTNVTFSPLLTKKVKEILDRGYHIVHIHGSLAPMLPLLAVNYSKSVNVFTFHAAHDESVWYELFKPILINSFMKIHVPIAVSEVAKQSVARYFPGNYRVIPNGIDTERFNPQVEPFTELMEKGVYNILFVGRLEPRKGFKVLIKALPYVKAIIPRIKLIVVGGGPLFKWYSNKVEDEIKENIVFVGTVPPEDLPRYYRSAHIFVSPAIGGESFGIVLLEAMASGTPIVASNIPGYSHVVENGREGLLVPPESPQLLASAIVTLLKNARLRKKMGERGREKAIEKYAWSRVAEQIEKVYFEALERVDPYASSVHR